MEQSSAKLFIQAGGYFHIALALFHLMFWRLFRWNEQLSRLHPVNRAITQVLNIRLIYVFIVAAVLSLLFTDDLLGTALGQALCCAIALFWFMRAAEQFFFFSMHIFSWMLFLVFVGGGVLYAWPLVSAADWLISL